jgi:hypothetical protein
MRISIGKRVLSVFLISILLSTDLAFKSAPDTTVSAKGQFKKSVLLPWIQRMPTAAH